MDRLNLTVSDRIEPASKIALSYALDLNQAEGYSESPVEADISNETRTSIQKAIEKLHPDVLKVAKKSLLGIYFCRDLGSSALTGYVFDENENAIAGYVLFDVDKMNQSANEWVTFREKTAFLGESRLKYKIATPENNSIARAYLYLLVHELAHIHSEINGSLPSYIEASENQIKPDGFVTQSWKDLKTSKYDRAIEWRSRVKFYSSNPALPSGNRSVSDVYKELDHTNFVSLYAMLDPWEDFAETSAFLYLCESQCKVSTDSYETIDYRQRPGMKEKLRIIERIWAEDYD